MSNSDMYKAYYKISWPKQDGSLSLCHLSFASHQSHAALCGVTLPELDRDEFRSDGAPCHRCFKIADEVSEDEIANRYLNSVGHY